MFNILTGFTYRGLSPHKFTPAPGVHTKIKSITNIMFDVIIGLRYYSGYDKVL
ncbi:hypothetical protein PITCH_A640115 [uncultured Desulfobacterium sp.]|uniref:Uncharacterized protein n=1 Tax=uncultured Desulfobacterium sp. TaxID=201089 RepID=A0A445N1J4_9BACT|nr:hypothetical protein PITCH_A640115 [uncultured Desulfobacterium sp.]